MQNQIQLYDTQIRQDEQGRFCLNDLHRASGGNPIHAPSQFLRLKGTKDFVQVLDSHNANMHSALEIINGGMNQGCYADEKIVYKYAAWISPEFEVKVYETFDKAVKGELNQKPTALIPQSFSEALMLAAQLQAEKERNAPKVAFVDHYVEVGTSKSFRETAKILKMPERALVNRLVEDKYLYRQSGVLLPYQSAHTKDLFTVKTGIAEHGHNYIQTRVTSKGIEFIASRYASELML